MPDLKSAIIRASRGKGPDGGHFGHQRRIPKSAYPEVERILLASTQRLRAASDFDSLHHLVNELIGPVYGVRELFVYDAAARIGAFLGVEPAIVYLHAGTLEGARRLGLVKRGQRTLTLEEIDEEVRELGPAEIENFLCVFKDEF